MRGATYTITDTAGRILTIGDTVEGEFTTSDGGRGVCSGPHELVAHAGGVALRPVVFEFTAVICERTARLSHHEGLNRAQRRALKRRR